LRNAIPCIITSSSDISRKKDRKKEREREAQKEREREGERERESHVKFTDI
jgi:hypothetical protein